MSARRATIADVAREAGVAPSTASVVFSGRASVAAATKERVLATAARLGYTGPDPRAASLRRGRSGVVAVVLQEALGTAFSDPVLRLMLDGLTESVASIGAGLLLLRDGADAAGQPALVTAPLDAAVLIGCGGSTLDAVKVLQARGVPVVVIEDDAGPGVPRILLDDFEAERELARHLAGLGHRDVAIVTLATTADRVAGFIDAEREAAISVDVARIRLEGAREIFTDAPAYAARASLIDEGLAAGRKLLDELSPRPTAVIAQSDLLATGVIRAAQERGLRVPDDLSVTGFDGVTVDGLAPYVLTTAVQPATEKGRAAGAAVVAMLADDDPVSVRLTCTFRAGTTTGPVPGGS